MTVGTVPGTDMQPSLPCEVNGFAFGFTFGFTFVPGTVRTVQTSIRVETV